jgi:hypothetical protein
MRSKPAPQGNGPVSLAYNSVITFPSLSLRTNLYDLADSRAFRSEHERDGEQSVRAAVVIKFIKLSVALMVSVFRTRLSRLPRDRVAQHAIRSNRGQQ